MPSRPAALTALLRDLEADDLREVIAELCKLNPQNRTFVELFLLGSDAVDTGAVLDAFSARLRTCFFSRTQHPRSRPELAEARRLLREHERLAADHPGLAAEGALVYVEAAAAYAAALYERGRYLQTATADAAVRMFERFVRVAIERPALAERLSERARSVAHLDRRMRRLLLALLSRDAAALAPGAALDDGYRVEYDEPEHPGGPIIFRMVTWPQR